MTATEPQPAKLRAAAALLADDHPQLAAQVEAAAEWIGRPPPEPDDSLALPERTLAEVRRAAEVINLSIEKARAQRGTRSALEAADADGKLRHPARGTEFPPGLVPLEGFELTAAGWSTGS